jgi:hypothetical protein
MSSNEPLTREELTVWMTGNTMPITRHENMERVLALLDENSRLHATLATVQAEYARVVEELRDVKADRVILEARWEKAERERDEARDAATWEGKEALAAALEAVERQGEASHERAIAAEATAALTAEALAASEAVRERLAGALRAIDQGCQDAGQDPYVRGEETVRDIAVAALASAASPSTVLADEWLAAHDARVRAEERAKLQCTECECSTLYAKSDDERLCGDCAREEGRRAGLEEAALMLENEGWDTAREVPELVRALASTPAKEKPPAAPTCPDCGGDGVVLRGPRQRDDDLDEWEPCPDCRGSTRGGGRK